MVPSKTQMLCLFAFITVIWTMCLPTEVNTGRDDCKSTCPSDKAIYKQTCISTCPPHTRRLETDLARYCLIDNEFNCLGRLCGGDFPYCYQANCVKTCPEYTVTYNDTCMLRCPADAPYVTVDQCTGICLTGRKVCSLKCPETHPFVFHSESFNFCLQTCPDFTAASYAQSTCSTKCPRSAPYLFNKTCHNICPDTHMLVLTKISKYNIIPTCTQSCSDETVVDGNVCVEFCPSGKHLFNKTCVGKCPKSHPNLYPRNQYIINLDTKHYGRAAFICVESCINVEADIPWLQRLYSWATPAIRLYKNVCVGECPATSKFDYNGICVKNCPSNESFLQPTSGTTIKCVNYCSEVYYNRTCMDYCPSEAQYRMNKTCYKTCPNDFPFLQRNAWDYSCVDSCKTFYYNKKCVSECPKEAKYQHNITCVSKCDGDLPFSYSSVTKDETWPYKKHYNNSCVKSCPNLETLDKDCVDSCPKDEKYILNSTCVSICYGNLPYAYKQTTSEKRYPYKEHIKYICMQSCPLDTFLYNDTNCVANCPKDANFIFESSCVNECPLSNPFNYTKNGKGFGIYQCVESCPNKTFFYKETCFDNCPENLKTHIHTCTESCPISHPYTYIQLIQKEPIVGSINKCLKRCPDGTVINDHFCDKLCPANIPYLENNRCVNVCPNSNALVEITNQGKKCHDKCPHHLFIMDDNCVEKCPDNRLIVGSSCKDIGKCPYHTYLEHSEIGKRCTNKCSAKFYLDGLDCIKECPPQKVIAGISCLDECPPAFPLSHKDFSSKPRIHCYGTCPSDYVANGTECIESSTCQVENHFTYRNRCYEKCPHLTIEYGYKSCASMNIFITFLVVCILCIIIPLTLIYVATCFTGWSSRTREYTATFNREKQSREEDNDSNTTPLISFENGGIENKHSEHSNSIEVRSDIEDIMAELDDGYKTSTDRNFRVKYEPVQKETRDRENEDKTHTNCRNETKDVHIEVLSTEQ
ncbi:proprotein convertase subtilisin/kexin type 5-like [Mytilus californianus]|uniref:proprotein convertase subtilisin/kexin type 5-like n=1 Tax=Mytilus californianus TaxID=6549 RepID=UPI00224820BC|nr:proprotein convertase subtilisin/kexin type 5-like [Mytilus californianus]